jgi:acyl carrier protein
MQGSDLKREIKELLVSELNLSGRDPGSIDDEAPLFVAGDGGGLGLDSLDALQIAMFVEERFGVRVPEGDEARPIFRSVATLAAFVEREQKT